MIQKSILATLLKSFGFDRLRYTEAQKSRVLKMWTNENKTKVWPLVRTSLIAHMLQVFILYVFYGSELTG